MKIKYLTLIILLSICSFGGCSMGQGVTTNTTKQKTTSIVIDSNNDGENNAKDYSDLEGKIESLPPNEELNVNYCNEKPYKDLITIQYPAGLFERLTEKFKKDTEITYAELSKEFKFECIRKAGSCYYVILMEDDGKKTFLFFKENLELKVIRRFTSFLSKADFDFVEIGKTTIEEIQAMDPNTHIMPWSAFLGTAHVVKEGGLFIYYELKEEIWVKKIEFYENNRLLDLEQDDTILYEIPYILDIDKQ